MVLSFALLHTVISDSATCFTIAALLNSIKHYGVSWRVLTYAPTFNDLVKRMVGISKVIAKMVSSAMMNDTTIFLEFFTSK